MKSCRLHGFVLVGVLALAGCRVSFEHSTDGGAATDPGSGPAGDGSGRDGGSSTSDASATVSSDCTSDPGSCGTQASCMGGVCIASTLGRPCSSSAACGALSCIMESVGATTGICSKPCQQDADCDGGHGAVCGKHGGAVGHCSQACSTATACFPNSVCSGGSCAPSCHQHPGYCGVQMCQADGTCGAPVGCANNSTYCNSGSDCCSGQCVGNLCAAAPACKPVGNKCTRNTECCANQACYNGQCSTFCGGTGGSAGNSCLNNDECCNGYHCDNGTCVAGAPICVASRGDCSATWDTCCSGLVCSPNFTCDTCALLLDACSATNPCCDGYLCVGGQCALPQCKKAGESCSGDCCSGLVCQSSGTCVGQSSCGNQGQSCGAASPCCSGLTCAGGVCSSGTGCSAQGGNCDANHPCCGALVCQAGKCATASSCATQGQGCGATTPCCGGTGLSCQNGKCQPPAMSCNGDFHLGQTFYVNPKTPLGAVCDNAAMPKNCPDGTWITFSDGSCYCILSCDGSTLRAGDACSADGTWTCKNIRATNADANGGLMCVPGVWSLCG